MNEKKKLLTEAQVAQVDDLGGELVEVEEWGGWVRLAVLSITDAAKLSQKSDIDIRVRIVGACMVGEDGARLFTEDQLDQLAMKNHAVIARLCAKAIDINKLTVAPAVAADTKNSETGPGEDSPSA